MVFLIPLGLIALIAVLAAPHRKIVQLERRLARMERSLDAVLAGTGVRPPDAEFGPVAKYLVEGKKIRAIKAYREQSGAGLKEAKDAVDRIAAELHL